MSPPTQLSMRVCQHNTSEKEAHSQPYLLMISIGYPTSHSFIIQLSLSPLPRLLLPTQQLNTYHYPPTPPFPFMLIPPRSFPLPLSTFPSFPLLLYNYYSSSSLPSSSHHPILLAIHHTPSLPIIFSNSHTNSTLSTHLSLLLSCPVMPICICT